jgi:hypothetical protein
VVPSTFETFFLASAGAGGTLIGLLFVALSIHPQRTFGASGLAAAQQQRLAEATLLTLINGFVISSVALLPRINAGGVAVVLGGVGFITAAVVSLRVAGLHQHRASRLANLRHWPRVVLLGALATALYTGQVVIGLHLLREPDDASPFLWLGLVMISLYGVGVVRAWTLLGNPQHGWSGWLNPLQDLPEAAETRLSWDEVGSPAGTFPVGVTADGWPAIERSVR